MTEQIREALAAALDATDVDALVTKAHVERFLDDVTPALASRLADLTPAGDTGLVEALREILDDPNGGPVKVGVGHREHMHAEPVCAFPHCEHYLNSDAMTLARIDRLLSEHADAPVAGDTGLVKALRELHRRGYESAADEVWGHSPRCQECAQMFPCPTIRLLSEHAESPSGGGER